MRARGDRASHICPSVRTHTAKRGVVLPPCFPVVNLPDSSQKQIFNRGKWPKKTPLWQREKVIMPEVKFQWSINGVLEELADWGSVDI